MRHKISLIILLSQKVFVGQHDFENCNPKLFKAISLAKKNFLSTNL